MNNLISVTIPSYNGEKYITECIKSIQTQGSPVEITVIDDISTDNTVSIARELGCEVIINTEHKGQVAGKNTGIKAARGNYWLTIDQDDVLTPGALKRFCEEFEQNQAAMIVMAKLKDFCSPDTPQEAKFCKPEPFRGILTGAAMFKKEVFDKIGFFREGVLTGDVIDLTTRVNRAGINITNIDFVSCARRIHGSNYGITNRKDEYKDYARLLRDRLVNN